MNIITWNMQGATGFGENKWNAYVKRFFLQLNAETICLQEAGAYPASANPIAGPPWLNGFAPPALRFSFLQWNLGTQNRPLNTYILWLQTDPNGNRVNLAIVSSIVPLSLIYAPEGLYGGRPAIGLRFPYPGGYADIFTLHAFSGGGGDAPGLLNNINATGLPWFAAGDYNRDPATWTPAIIPMGTVPCFHNGGVTHPGSGTNLDYAFKNPGPVITGQVIDNFVASDHYPVAYTL